MNNFSYFGNPIDENKKGRMLHIGWGENMRRKNRTHLALGLMLMAVIAGTCTVVYQSGSKNVPNEKEFVLNEGDSIDEAMKTEEKETTEENRNSETQNPESKDPETQDVNTSQVEGERVMEEET